MSGEPRRAAAARSAPATGCSSPARRAACTRSRSSRASCSTRTRGRSRTTTSSACPTARSSPNQVGVEYLALRPLLSDFVMSMPRGAAIVYPKDAAQILAQADIFPGATRRRGRRRLGRALALAAPRDRPGGPPASRSSVARSSPTSPAATSRPSTAPTPRTGRSRSATSPRCCPRRSTEASVDRVVLDMLAPWECIDAVSTALKPGGVLLCYIATVTQLSRVAEAIRATGEYTEPQSSETMVRGWHVQGLAVRPDHRMIAHTGFLITARRLAPGTVLPELKRRPSKTEFSDEDVEAWTPGRARRAHRSATRACASACGQRMPRPTRSRGRTRPAATTRPAHRRRPEAKPGRLPTPLRDPSKNRGSVRSSLALIATAGLVAIALTGCASGARARGVARRRPPTLVDGHAATSATQPRSSSRPRSRPKRRSAPRSSRGEGESLARRAAWRSSGSPCSTARRARSCR